MRPFEIGRKVDRDGDSRYYRLMPARLKSDSAGRFFTKIVQKQKLANGTVCITKYGGMNRADLSACCWHTVKSQRSDQSGQRSSHVSDDHRPQHHPVHQVLRRHRRAERDRRHPRGRNEAGRLHRHPRDAPPRGDDRVAGLQGDRGDRPRPPRRPQPAQPAGDGDRDRREPRAGAVRGQRPDQQPPGQPGLLEPHPGRRVRHRGNDPRGGQRPGRPDRGDEGVRPRVRRAGHRRGDARRCPERADGGAAHADRAPAREGPRDAAPVRRQSAPVQRGRQVQAVPGVRGGGERRADGPRQPQPQGGGLRGERQGGGGHRGRSERARAGCGDGQRRGKAPARPDHPDAAAGEPAGLPRDRRPQGQRTDRGQARRRAVLAGGGEGRAG